MNLLFFMLMGLAAFIAFILFIVFVLVPIFRGIGWGIAAVFSGIGWVIAHIFEFVGGMISDAVRLLGSALALVVLALLVPLNVIIARWSAAGHYAQAVKREAAVGLGCLYRVLIRRPLKLLWLHGLVEGIEERVPEAMYAAPTSDSPSKRTGQFDGYTIVGSLPGGGSGGKLYIARPDEQKRARLAGQPEYVVIKSFALAEGSSLPQIVRESRALECARQLGHVLEHGMEEHRFHYVMPYHAGDNLAIITRDLHARSDGRGLGQRQLHEMMSYMRDLLATLSLYHAGGFWHKDVKPENVIVHDGRAHLVDLGLITPLKSAMTLTTHGTEYFRDPEMVRQALRGVKVHQVNGAKFDIYAVGAVLYFMIENTFPAHGGLSRFSKNSPEALRWVVRRAMAEYNQRYESAEMMLADLEAVVNAAADGDPFSVKPAQLPSMQAGRIEDVDVEIETESPQVEQAKAAGSPIPPRTTEAKAQAFARGAGIAAGYGAESGARGPLPSGPQRRPKLRVTNWFTGAYVVDDPGSATGRGGSAGRGGEDDGKRPPFLGAPRSARDQLRAAQSRARELRRRAADHRQAVSRRRFTTGLDRQPAAAVVLICVLVLGLLIGVPVVLLHSPMRMVEHSETARGVELRQSAVLPVDASFSEGLPLLLVVDPDAAAQRWAEEQLKWEIERHRELGFHIVQDLATDSIAEAHARELIQRWQVQPNALDDRVSEDIEDFLALHDLYGFLYIKQSTAAGGNEPLFTASIIRSSRWDAAQRRWPTIESTLKAPNEPFLLINDHPTRADRRVMANVERLVGQYELRGWSITVDDELEAAVRKLLPAGTIPHSLHSSDGRSARLQTLLREHDFGGLLYIFASPGSAPPHERVAVSVISASDLATDN